MAKKSPASGGPGEGGGAMRRDRVEQMRREQKAKERRRTLLVVGSCGVVGVLLIGGVAAYVVSANNNSPANASASSFGVPAAAASCTTETVDDVEGTQQHVPDGTVVQYRQTPPIAGEHYQNWVTVGDRPFYTAADRAPLENYVHNLEHGYAVAFYSAALPEDQKQELSDLARNLRAQNDTRKFIAVEWDDSRGAMPEGKTVAVSRWGLTQGYQLQCGAVSGEAIAAFFAEHPTSDSPEPNAG